MTNQFIFLALVAFVLLAALAASWTYLPRRATLTIAMAGPLWLLWVGALSARGIIADTSVRPPGIVYVFGPILLFMIFFAVRSKTAGIYSRMIPIQILIGLQTFRVGVELGIHRLGEEGLVPRLMTWDGGNVDILVGLSAPLAAWAAVRGKAGGRAAIAWNVLGLVALANVAARAVMTAPGPLNVMQSNVPNLAVGMFPYTYLAGVLAPFAVLLHILSLRSLRASTNKSEELRDTGAGLRGAGS